MGCPQCMGVCAGWLCRSLWMCRGCVTGRGEGFVRLVCGARLAKPLLWPPLLWLLLLCGMTSAVGRGSLLLGQAVLCPHTVAFLFTLLYNTNHVGRRLVPDCLAYGSSISGHRLFASLCQLTLLSVGPHCWPAFSRTHTRIWVYLPGPLTGLTTRFAMGAACAAGLSVVCISLLSCQGLCLACLGCVLSCLFSVRGSILSRTIREWKELPCLLGVCAEANDHLSWLTVLLCLCLEVLSSIQMLPHALHTCAVAGLQSQLHFFSIFKVTRVCVSAGANQNGGRCSLCKDWLWVACLGPPGACCVSQRSV